MSQIRSSPRRVFIEWACCSVGPAAAIRSTLSVTIPCAIGRTRSGRSGLQESFKAEGLKTHPRGAKIAAREFVNTLAQICNDFPEPVFANGRRQIWADETILLERIEWISGINEAGATDGEKSFDLADRFSDHAVRLASLKLVL